MTLYHGSNMEIDNIDLSLCQVSKDFGCGFYLNDIEAQAKGMATRRVKLAKKGTPVVTSYYFDETLLNDGSLLVKRFEMATEEWALFILANRNNEERKNNHVYDVVVGPVADDGVAFQLERYEQGLIALDVLVKELTYRKLNSQYFFGTEKAILKLNKLS